MVTKAGKKAAAKKRSASGSRKGKTSGSTITSARVPSAYQNFCSINRPQLQEGLSLGKQQQQLGQRWRALSEEQKASYKEMVTSASASAPKTSSSSSSSNSSSSTSKSKKSGSPDKKVAIRKPNAYQLFSKSERPNLPPGLSFSEQQEHLGQRWRALSEEEKAKYK